MNMEKVDNNELKTLGEISRALVNAIKEECDYDYFQHDDSMKWAINEISEDVNNAWRKNMMKIRDLSDKLDELLISQGI